MISSTNLTECLRGTLFLYHLRVRADETGLLRAGGRSAHAVHRVRGGQTQGLAAAEGSGGQAPLPGSAAVVRDAKSAALVVV